VLGQSVSPNHEHGRGNVPDQYGSIFDRFRKRGIKKPSIILEHAEKSEA